MALSNPELPVMDIPDIPSGIAPVMSNLSDSAPMLVAGVPEVPGIPDAVPVGPESGKAVPVPEEDIPMAGLLVPNAERISASLPEVAPVAAAISAVPMEPM